MKKYIVRGGYTVHEQFEINVKAKDEKEAQVKALKIPVDNWEELQSSSDSGFVIDDVWEDEEWKNIR